MERAVEDLYREIRLPRGLRARLESRRADQTTKLGQARELVALALKLARNCHASYRKASPETKRLRNQAFFEEVIVRDRKVVEVRYAQLFQAIFATQEGRVSDKGFSWR